MGTGGCSHALNLGEQVERALELSRAAAEAFKDLPEDTGFRDGLLAFEELSTPLDRVGGWVGLLSQVHPEREVRQQADELEQKLQGHHTAMSLDCDLYAQLAALKPDASMDAESERLWKHALRDYRRAGVDRDEALRARVGNLRAELVHTGQDFDRNLAEDSRGVRVAQGHARLAGLPADFLRAHPEEEDGSLWLSMDPDVRAPLMAYAEDSGLRRDYYIELNNRGMPHNLGLLDRLAELRFELAGLLGYSSWAAYETEVEMVRDADSVRRFLDRVVELARPRAQREHAQLLAEKRRDEPGAHCIYPYEFSFLVERLRRRIADFDSRDVRAYFSYENVRDGVLATAAEVFGVQFTRVDEVETWHPSVEVYELMEDEELLGRFYLDMHPREGKYKHAAMFDLGAGLDGPPEACLVCNFPGSKPGEPGLLEHEQVTTFFHEFGHLLHHLFAGGRRWLSTSGIATEWDFVEVPSQFFEEWAWRPEVLQRFAVHVQSGERIPADLVERMRAAEEVGNGIMVLRQMFFARLALECFGGDPSRIDSTKLVLDLEAELLLTPHLDGCYPQASFGHLHGYGSRYYTYMWSLVIAKDLCASFEGAWLDPKLGRRYRREVLQAGGSRDAADLVRAFLGRDFGTEAFEKWLGGAPAPVAAGS